LVFQNVSKIPVDEMVIFASDMSGHMGRSNTGYDGVHGGFGYGIRNADGLGLVICNTCFMKQDCKLGPNMSTVGYMLAMNQDKKLVQNAGVF